MPSAVRVVTRFQDADDVFSGDAPTVALDGWHLQTTGRLDRVVSTFYDDFARADQTGLGDTPTGQTWLTTGAGDPGFIASGKMGSNAANLYAYYKFPSGQFPYRIGGKFTLNDVTDALALIFSADDPFNITKMVHLVFNSVGPTITWWDTGLANQAVAYLSRPQNTWITGGLTLGQEYEIWLTVDGDTATIEYPDGTTTYVWDSHFSSVYGPTVVWEIAGVAHSGTWNEVRAYQSSRVRTTQSVEAQTLLGQVGTPEKPSAVFAQNLWISPLGITGGALATGLAAIYVQHQEQYRRGLFVNSSVSNGSTVVLAASVGSNEPYVELRQGATTGVRLYMPASTGDFRIKLGTYGGTASAPTLTGSDILAILQNKNIGLNTSSQFGSGVGVIGIAKATTAPTVATTDAGVLYIDPTTGDLMFWGSSGAARTVALA